MGTSKLPSTPSGGRWTPIKRLITNLNPTSASSQASTLLGQTVAATGGLGSLASDPSSAAGRSHARAARAAAVKSTAGVAAFGATAIGGGLGQALQDLGLAELEGRGAAEIIRRVSESIASESLESRELIENAINESLLEACALTEDRAYEDLEKGLDTFLVANGIEGLLEVFLANLVFDQIWSLNEQWFQKQHPPAEFEALASAISDACKIEIATIMREMKERGEFSKGKWFGQDGLALAERVVAAVEEQLLSFA